MSHVSTKAAVVAPVFCLHPEECRRSLTSPDVPQSFRLLLHPNALPAGGPLQVERGDEGQRDGGQVLLHAAARHPDERGQRVVADGVIDAVGQHVPWRREEESARSTPIDNSISLVLLTDL